MDLPVGLSHPIQWCRKMFNIGGLYLTIPYNCRILARGIHASSMQSKHAKGSGVPQDYFGYSEIVLRLFLVSSLQTPVALHH